MKELIKKINNLRSDRRVACIMEDRTREFEEKQKENSRKWFLELCFCILTANSSAKRVLEICEFLGEDMFLSLSMADLSRLLKKKGYRFYNKRAQYIVEAREFSEGLKTTITSFNDEFEAREWLLGIKGIGLKESNHFLRNVGYKNVAILDRHILRILHEYDVVGTVKSLTRTRYYFIEGRLRGLADEVNLSLAELDLFLWYMETGEVLK